MEGIISNFRGGRHTKYDKQMVIIPKGTAKRDAAEKMVDKTVIWKTPTGKEMKGKIVSAHGNSGAVRVIFERGMPGQAIGEKVVIQ